MNPAIEDALARDRTVDITTTGRRTGRERRIEIWMFQVEGTTYITGAPGRRGWYANLLADPRLTLHLKQSVRADLAASARPITDAAQRRAVLTPIAELAGLDLDAFVAGSPLVTLAFDEP